MDGGGEKSVADGGSGPTTHGNESETDHGKGHWGSRPMLTRIGAGKGSRYIDGSTLGGIQVGRQRWEIWEVGVAAVGIGPPARHLLLGSLSDGELVPSRGLGARMPARIPGTAGGRGKGEAGHTPQGPGELPGLTPELERVAATWAAGQAA